MSGKYMVVFKAQATKEQIQNYANDITQNGGSIGHIYDDSVKGFSATITPAYFQKLQSSLTDSNNLIDIIEPDGLVTTQ